MQKVHDGGEDKRMCGIAVCLKSKGVADHNKFEKMVDIIAHRGPDDRGTFYEGSLALGHRRLSIIDLSSDGHQPFIYQDNYVTVFNGEIYNYIELRAQLEKKGYRFRTKTDTEVLVAAYDCFGEKCVEYFNGMWSFVIYDRAKQILFCSRDRFGVKPFYYTRQEGMFLAASEIKQFFEMLEKNPKANTDTLLQFIIRGNLDYSEQTMFKDIFQLPGGHNLIYDMERKKYEIRRYFDIRKVPEKEQTYQEACKEFYRKFHESVKLRLRADVPTGYCLSGGLDSSAIVCMADKIVRANQSAVEQHTISSCFEDKRYDEQEYIDEVIKATGVYSHKTFPQETNLFEDLDSLLWHMDEPFASTSMYAQWNVFRAAKECGMKVMLDGQGSDEQLAGYTHFYIVMVADRIRRGQFKKLWNEWKIYKRNRASTETYISSYEILLPALGALLVPDRMKYHFQMLFYHLFPNKQPFSKKQLRQVLKNEIIYPIRRPRLYIAEFLRNSMSSLMHYEDRNSMAHSIESRVPFLDCNLTQAVYAMPFDYKLRGGVTKAVLRDGLRSVLPDKIRKRYSKLGFVTPEDQWINNNFEKYRAELQDAVDTLSGILEPDTIMKWFDANEGQVRRSDFTPWRIICAGHWVKLFHVELT